MSTYSTSLKLTLIGDGEQTGTWGQTTNTNLGTLLEQAIVGQTSITMVNADYTLTDLNGTTDEARNAVIIVTGNQNATYSVIVPAVQKLYMVTNSLNASAIAYIKPSGGSAFQVPNGRTMYLYCTGTQFFALDYVQYAQNLVTGGTITTGAISCTSLTSSGAVSGTTITASTQFSGPGTGITGTAAGLSVGGNAATATTVSTTVASGATGTTQSPGTNNTTIATTAFVQAATTALGLGTMATQNASAVAITGGTINGVSGTNASLTVGNATNATTAATVSTTVASGAVGTTQAAGTANTTIATTAFVAAAMAVLYPVGSIYTSTVATNPNTLFGFGTWVQYAAGQFLMGRGGAYTVPGGSADAIVVSHNHTATSSVSDPGHTHAFTTGTGSQNHTHLLDTYIGVNAGGGGTAYAGNNSGGGSGPSEATQPSGADHTHSGTTGAITTGVTVATSISTAGASGTNANLPPYIVVYMWNRTA
jgi:hypothetical protein